MMALQFEQVSRRVWRARAAGYDFRVRREASAGRFPYYAAVCRRAHDHRRELLFARFMTLAGAEAWLDSRAQLVIPPRRGENVAP